MPTTTHRSLGINLFDTSYYAGSNYFNDLTRQGSVWHSFPQDDTGAFSDDRVLTLDARGYPTALAADQGARSILQLEADGFAAGTYTLTWQGQGDLQLTTHAGDFRFEDRNDQIASNSASVTLTAPDEPDGEAVVLLDILSTDPDMRAEPWNCSKPLARFSMMTAG